MSRRRKRWTDNEDFYAMVVRMVRALGRRAGAGDVEDLRRMRELVDVVDQQLADAVRSMREVHGFSWQSIADEMGTTRQAAQQRWGKR